MKALIPIILILTHVLLLFQATSYGSEPFRGHLILGHEVRSFTPCEKDVEYWVLDQTGGDLKQVYQKLAYNPYQPIYVEVRGLLAPPPLDGFGADYDRQLIVQTLRRAGVETRGCEEDLRGMTFRASGNEPFWNVRISENEISFSELGKPKLIFPQAHLEVADSGRMFTSNIKDPAPNHIRISITEKRCIDTMSGEYFSFIATVSLDGNKYVGCARESWPDHGLKETGFGENSIGSKGLISPSRTLTLDSLKNTQYQSGFSADGRIELSDGIYKEKILPGSATELVVMLSDKVAYGDLNDDGEDDAATILITDSGGSGTFRHLAVVLNQDGSPKHVASQLLGDRVKVKSLSVGSGAITVEMITHGPNDPICCPTLETTQHYILRGGKLVIAPVPGLMDRKWALHSFGTIGSEETLLPDTEISVEFAADGRLHGSGGCNRYFSSHEIGPGDSLTIKQIGSTRMACPPDIMDQEMNYFKALQRVSAFKVKNQVLQLFYENGEQVLNFNISLTK